MFMNATISNLNRSSSGMVFSHEAPSTRLIVNADDFGLSKAINDGIVMANRMGLVTSASIMPVGKAFDHALQKLEEAPQLDVGVHLTLVAEEPLIHKNSSLLNGGNRFPKDIASFMLAYFKGGIRLSDIRREWSAQIEKALDRRLAITHLDSHQHVHVLPGIAEITQELADRYRVPFIRIPSEQFKWYMFRDVRSAGRLAGDLALKTFCALFKNRTERAISCNTPRFLGFFFGGRLDAAGLNRILASTSPGSTYELMCHPGFAPLEPEYRKWNYRHEAELMALASPRLRNELENKGIHLCRFCDLLQ